MNEYDTNKKLFVLRDDDYVHATLLLTKEQAAMFYYLKENDFLCDEDLQLAPVDCSNPSVITFEEYHY